MSSGERPIGTAKGKQPNTEALCQTPPCPPSRRPNPKHNPGMGAWTATDTKPNGSKMLVVSSNAFDCWKPK